MRETPLDVVRAFERLGGKNPFGDPNFRAIWADERLDWIGGKWEDYDANGILIRAVDEVRYVPKYAATIRERWIVEKWYPPEWYGSPDSWRKTTQPAKDFVEQGNLPQLGPYPARGDYEHCCTIEDADGNFVPLTVALAEEIVYLVRAKQAQKRTLAERKAALEARAQKQSEENLIILEDAQRPFAAAGLDKPFVTVGSGETYFNGHKATIL